MTDSTTAEISVLEKLSLTNGNWQINIVYWAKIEIKLVFD